MNDPSQSIERGLARYRELIEEQERLRAEFDASREGFFGGVPPDAPEEGGGAELDREFQLAELRHLEYFVLERPSDHLQGVPVEALLAAWVARAEPSEPDSSSLFLGSLAGVFEVTGVDASRGLWLRDLLGTGEYPVGEPGVASEVRAGDLLVGRVYPEEEEGGFRLSPAVACFRNRELLEALRKDLERARQGRRGVLRISQRDLEHMFHGAAAAAAAPAQSPTRSTEEVVEDASRFLLSEGVEEAELEAIFETLRNSPCPADNLAPGAGDALGAILDRLAFETSIDLECARRFLLQAWIALSRTAEPPPADAAPRNGHEPAVGRGDVRAALAEFDRGRSEGKDLESLFQELERSLGLGSVADEEEDVVAPDFPGVVGAMVEEFLWDTGRERGEEAAQPLQCLRLFARFAQDIGVFENLGARDLLVFSSCWVIEEGVLGGGDAARQLLSALKAFCRWCEETQEVALWSAFEEHHRGLSEALPRLAEANHRAPGSGPQVEHPGMEHPGSGLYSLAQTTQNGHAVVEDTEGRPLEIQLDPELGPWLRAGDLLRGSIREDGRFALQRAYPPQAGELVRDRT